MKNSIRLIAACLLLLISSAAHAASSLADAAEKQDSARLNELLQQKTDINVAQADGMTALHWAAYNDDLAAAKQLVAAGADVKAANRYGVTPLSLACVNGNTELVELLLTSGADANAALHGGETVLMTAARTGKIGPVKSLLAHGADLNAKERKGQTAIMWAAAEGHAEVVATLIAAGADYRAALPSGLTPLFFAIREGHIDTVRTLLKAGIDVNETMQPKKKHNGKEAVAGTSPLCLAIENGHFELAVDLLDAGADPNDQRSGYSPLHQLTWVRKPNRGDGDDGDPPPIGSGKLTSLEFAKALVAHGADVNLPLKKGPSGKGTLGKTGATPFLMAAATADVPYMRLLVELGADPQTPNAEHCTPLLAAAGAGVRFPEETAGTEPEVLEAIQFLLDHGADINAVDDNGETAMHGAAYRCHPKVAQFLADHGAKITVWNHADKLTWTPLQIAEGHRIGAFKPSAETTSVIRNLMLAAGVAPKSETAGPDPDLYNADASKKKAP
jgi:ankyrin repeat protein